MWFSITPSRRDLSAHLLEVWEELTAGETMATWRAADLRSGAEQRDDMAGLVEGVNRGRMGDTFAQRSDFVDSMEAAMWKMSGLRSVGLQFEVDKLNTASFRILFGWEINQLYQLISQIPDGLLVMGLIFHL